MWAFCSVFLFSLFSFIVLFLVKFVIFFGEIFIFFEERLTKIWKKKSEDSTDSNEPRKFYLINNKGRRCLTHLATKGSWAVMCDGHFNINMILILQLDNLNILHDVQKIGSDPILADSCPGQWTTNIRLSTSFERTSTALSVQAGRSLIKSVSDFCVVKDQNLTNLLHMSMKTHRPKRL